MIKFRYAGSIYLLIRLSEDNNYISTPDCFFHSAALTIINEENNRL